MNRIDDNGYFDYVLANLREVNEKQSENILKAAKLMADAIEADKLIFFHIHRLQQKADI